MVAVPGVVSGLALVAVVLQVLVAVLAAVAVAAAQGLVVTAVEMVR